MDTKSQQKVIRAGFKILRADDHPQPRIKYKGAGRQEWITLEKFSTKAARNRRLTELLKMNLFITD